MATKSKNAIKIKYYPAHNMAYLVQKDRRETVMEVYVTYVDLQEILKIYFEDDSVMFISEARDKYKKVKEALNKKSIWNK